MTDIERERLNAICEVAGIEDTEDLSDGFHTFRQLYYQRMILFATIVKQNKDKAWKSLRHEDGELCFGGGWFIVGIDTPEGSYTYHYENKYFDLFDCKILDYGKHWDGHTEKDVTRLLSLPSAKHETQEERTGMHGVCLDAIDRQAAINTLCEICDRPKHPDWVYTDEFCRALGALPSVQSNRKTGHWIPQDFNDSDGMIATAVYYFPKCSVCGIASNYTNFCPNCGAEMKEKANE